MLCFNGPLPVARDRVFIFKGLQSRRCPEKGNWLAMIHAAGKNTTHTPAVKKSILLTNQKPGENS